MLEFVKEIYWRMGILSDGNFRAFTRYKMSLSSNQYIRGSIRRDISRSL